MAYAARIICDSISPAGVRLTTFELTYPRFVHAELMTHREFSRNSGSSRAIPIEKMIERIEQDPVMPVYWGKNQKGMQAAEELTGTDRVCAEIYWKGQRDAAIAAAKGLLRVGVHKQIVNRLLEPWMWITVLVSSTSYANFFKLRCDPAAQPEIQKIAYMMRDLYFSQQPRQLPVGAWHLPLLAGDEIMPLGLDAIKVSVGRCARVSYLTHDGKRDPQADIDLHDRLLTSGHWSPFEHVAVALPDDRRFGNFSGWLQYRKNFPQEYVRDYRP